MDLVEYFTENDVVRENGVFYFKCKQRRTHKTSTTISPDTKIDGYRVVDVVNVLGLLRRNNIHPDQVDNALLKRIIERYIGCSLQTAVKILHSLRLIVAVLK